MTILIKILQFIVSLSLIVIIHEFGHFIFAKMFKCRVEKFYLFFDPWFSLFKLKKGETEYGVGWVPLGGYVKISGMIDESMDKEQMKLPPKPWEFRTKTAPQRLMIMIAGVLMNFILAILIYIGVAFAWGDEYLPTSSAKYGIEVSDAGRQIGFETGDKILTVDHHEVEKFYEIVSTIALDKAQTVQVERNGKVVDVEISEEDIALMLKSKGIFSLRVPFNVVVSGFADESPAQLAGIKKDDKIVAIDSIYFNYHDEFGNYIKSHAGQTVNVIAERGDEILALPVCINDAGMMGISYSNNASGEFEFKTIKYGFFEAFPAGIARGWKTSVDYLKQFKLIFNKTTKGYESLGGFITIGNIFPGQWNWHAFWDMTAFLSIILGIMNILPIPALDGGHVMFVLYEIITRRKPSDKFLEYAQMVGLSILLILVVYANLNDIIRLFK